MSFLNLQQAILKDESLSSDLRQEAEDQMAIISGMLLSPLFPHVRIPEKRIDNDRGVLCPWSSCISNPLRVAVLVLFHWTHIFSKDCRRNGREIGSLVRKELDFLNLSQVESADPSPPEPLRACHRSDVRLPKARALPARSDAMRLRKEREIGDSNLADSSPSMILATGWRLPWRNRLQDSRCAVPSAEESARLGGTPQAAKTTLAPRLRP